MNVNMNVNANVARKTFLALLILLVAGIVLVQSIRVLPPTLAFDVDDPAAAYHLSGFHAQESHDVVPFRWSHIDSTIRLEQFYAHPILLDLRLRSFRPPTTVPPPATRLVRGNWTSPPLTITNEWRHYQVLVPASYDTAHTIRLESTLFVPSNGDTRTLGVALNRVSARLPAPYASRAFAPLSLLLTLPLPLLSFFLVSTLLRAMHARRLLPGTPHLFAWISTIASPSLVLACLSGLAVLAPVGVALAFPDQWRHLVPFLWLVTILLAIGVWQYSTHQQTATPPDYGAWVVSASVPLAYAALILFLPLPEGMTMTNGDEPHYLLMAHSLYHDHDSHTLNNYLQGDYHHFYGARTIDAHLFSYNNRVIPIHIMMGLPLVILPAYMLAGLPGVQLLLALLTWLAVRHLYKLMQRFVAPPIALVTALLCGLTYPLLIYSHMIFPETVAFALVTFVLYHTFTPSASSPRWQALMVGCALAFLPHLHYKMAILMLSLLIFFVSQRPRRRIGALKWALPPVLLSTVAIPIWLYAVYGELSLQGFLLPIGANLLHESQSIPVGIPGLLFDQEYGLFFYAPLYALSLIGLGRLWQDKHTRANMLFLLSIYGSYHVLCGGFSGWYGGFSPVPRYLVPVLAIPAIGVARALEGVWQQQEWGRILLANGLNIWVTLLVLHNQHVMFGHDLGSNAIMREVYQAHTLIRWLPSFRHNTMAEGTLRLAICIVIAIVIWHVCGWLDRVVHMLRQRSADEQRTAYHRWYRRG
jgi:hypothetical protein